MLADESSTNVEASIILVRNPVALFCRHGKSCMCVCVCIHVCIHVLCPLRTHSYICIRESVCMHMHTYTNAQLCPACLVCEYACTYMHIKCMYVCMHGARSFVFAFVPAFIAHACALNALNQSVCLCTHSTIPGTVLLYIKVPRDAHNVPTEDTSYMQHVATRRCTSRIASRARGTHFTSSSKTCI